MGGDGRRVLATSVTRSVPAPLILRVDDALLLNDACPLAVMRDGVVSLLCWRLFATNAKPLNRGLISSRVKRGDSLTAELALLSTPRAAGRGGLRASALAWSRVDGDDQVCVSEANAAPRARRVANGVRAVNVAELIGDGLW